MVYLLDANVMIDANRDYYSIDRVPEFWDWLQHHGSQGVVKIPVEIYEEVKDGNDDLATWIRHADIKDALLLDAAAEPTLVSTAVEQGYAPDLTDDEILKIGRDPFLFSYALRDPGDHCIVTTEVSKPGKQRANRHIPDVAASLGIASCNTFDLARMLDFRTNWRA